MLKLSLSLSPSSSLLLVKLAFLSCLFALSCRSLPFEPSQEKVVLLTHLLLMLSLRSRTKLFFLFIASAKVTASCQVECQLVRERNWTLDLVLG